MRAGWKIWARSLYSVVVSARLHRRRLLADNASEFHWVRPQFKAKDLGTFVEECKGVVPAAIVEKIVKLCRSLNTKRETSEVVKSWIAEGNVFSQDVASTVSAWLVHCRHNVQALKFMSMVREERLSEMTSKLYSLEIAEVCHQLGPSKGEALFRSMPESLKTEEVITAFLSAVAKEEDSAKAEKLMDELGSGVPVEAWNEVLHMYLKKDRHDKLRHTYYRFKEKGLKPGLFTYYLVLQCRERVGGFEEVEMEFDAELKRANLENADARLFNLIMRSYAFLGKRKMVDRIWKLLKSEEVAAPDVHSYLAAIKSYGLFGDLDKAYELMEEMQQKFKQIPQNPYVLILEICVRLKMMDQAEKVMEKHIDKSYFYPYNFLVTGYVETNQIAKALKRLDDAFEIPFKNRKLLYKTLMALLPVFAKRGDIHSAEKLMANYGTCGDVKTYNALLNVYVSAKRMPTLFVERMGNHNIEPDDETRRLIETLESFWDHKPGRRTIWNVVNGRRVRRDEQMAHIKFSRDENKIRTIGLGRKDEKRLEGGLSTRILCMDALSPVCHLVHKCQTESPG